MKQKYVEPKTIVLTRKRVMSVLTKKRVMTVLTMKSVLPVLTMKSVTVLTVRYQRLGMCKKSVQRQWGGKYNSIRRRGGKCNQISRL